MAKKPRTIDEYLESLKPPKQEALEALRRTIHTLLPEAEECISYSMPAFRYQGRVIAGFLATKAGCSYYPFSGATLSTVSAELKSYSKTKSALHFEPEHPLPARLVQKLLEARMAEIDERVTKQ